MRREKKVGAVVFMVILLCSIMLTLPGCSCNGGKSSTSVQSTTSTTTLTSSITTTLTSSTTVKPLSTTTSATTLSSGNVLWGSPDGIVFISVPSGWNMNDAALFPGAAIGVADDANSEYVIVTERQQYQIGTNATINDYLTAVKAVFAKILSNPTWGSTSNITIGGCKGLAVQLSGTRIRDNANLVFFVNVLAGNKQANFYNVCAWTPSNMVNQNKASLEKIINSFQEIWPPKPNTSNTAIPNY